MKRIFLNTLFLFSLFWAAIYSESVGQNLQIPNVEKDSTEWVGEWADNGNLHYSYRLKLFPIGDGRMTGTFEWKLIWTWLPEHKPKVGSVAIEYLVGNYDPIKKVLNLSGIRRKDPADIISMDIYVINVLDNGSKLGGINMKPGNYQGRLYGEIVLPKPKPKPKVVVELKKDEKKVEKVKELPNKNPEILPSSPDNNSAKNVAKIVKPEDLEELNSREIITKQEIKSKEEQIRIRIYDNSMVDGDIISLNWNGEWILRYFKVVKVPKEIILNLKKGENTLVMHAENLGKYPPNTAAIQIDRGSKQEVIILNSTMGSSEALRFIKE